MGGKMVENVAKMCLEGLPKFSCVKHIQDAQSCLSLKRSLMWHLRCNIYSLLLAQCSPFPWQSPVPHPITHGCLSCRPHTSSGECPESDVVTGKWSVAKQMLEVCLLTSSYKKRLQGCAAPSLTSCFPLPKTLQPRRAQVSGYQWINGCWLSPSLGWRPASVCQVHPGKGNLGSREYFWLTREILNPKC